jgi:type VI secretion system protein ImpF
MVILRAATSLRLRAPAPLRYNELTQIQNLKSKIKNPKSSPMARPDAKSSLLPSILDRLIEPREGESTDLSARGQSVRDLEEAVRRDLQDLLNTRQTSSDFFPDETELSRSLLTFGLPELTTYNPTVPDHRKQLQEIIERAIRLFEPRLMNVRVTSITADSATGRGLRMSIEALLRVSPAPLPITFDTVVKSGTGEWQVVDPGGK